MGVKGLTSFIEDNPVLLQDFRLHDCKVILDGNNFVHFIYQKYNTSFQYDGDYSNYYEKILLLFNNLKSCNIIPYVVFDGGYDVSDSKLRTLMQRSQNRVKQAVKRNSLLPILANKMFLKALDQLSIQHVTCSFEADEEIAILANEWNCPVISNDSDFFVYNLKAGCLPLNYVDFRPIKHEKKYDYLATQKYHYDHYCEILDNFNPKMIPLLATVLGNDFIRRDTFMTFTRKFEKPKHKIKFCTKTVSKITAIISRFNKFNSFEEGQASITEGFVTTGGIASLQHVIDTSVKCYTKIESSKSYVANYFNGGFKYSQINRSDYFGRMFPEWLIEGLLKGNISPSIQNMSILHRIVLPCQQEDIDQPSSHKISMHIRQVLYGIMFQEAPKENKTEIKHGKKRKVTKQSHLEEVDRIGRGIRQVYVDPRMNIINYGKLPSLSDIESLTYHSRRELILSTLGISEKFLSGFSQSDHLLMSVLSYWVYHCDVSKEHLEGLILCIILLKIKNLPKNETNDIKSSKIVWNTKIANYFISIILFLPKFLLTAVSYLIWMKVLDIDGFIKQLSAAEIQSINLDLQMQTDRVQDKKDMLPNKALHIYAQYQSCLLFSILLNELVLSPFEEPVLWEMYDGLYATHFNHCIEARQTGCYDNVQVDLLSRIEYYPKLAKLYKSIAKSLLSDAKSRPPKLTKSKRRAVKTPGKWLLPVVLIILIALCTVFIVSYFEIFNK